MVVGFCQDFYDYVIDEVGVKSKISLRKMIYRFGRGQQKKMLSMGLIKMLQIMPLLKVEMVI